MIKFFNFLSIWLSAGLVWAWQGDISVSSVLIISVVFALLLTMISLVSPMVANRALISSNREQRQLDHERIKEMGETIKELERQKIILSEQVFELRRQYNELHAELQLARNHIIQMEENLRYFTDADDSNRR